MGSQFNYDDFVLDLHDIALLLNYERGTTEPRFRNAKLREVADQGTDFQTIRSDVPEWAEATVPKIGFVFDTPLGLTQKQKDEPDLPSNMLPQPVPMRLKHLTPNDLELYYWQVRNHDGCFKTIAIFQHFMDLFPWEFIRVRVRIVENNKPRSYTTCAADRIIVEFNLSQLRSMNMSFAKNSLYISGGNPVILHAVLAFPPSAGEEEDGAILDMASLQFGDVGRGFKGRGVFVLESVPAYIKRLDTIAVGNDYKNAKRTQRIRASPFDEYFKDVARRAKERLDKRQAEPWCGHCGAPSRDAPLKRCAKCRAAYYCDAEHQLAAWQYHKHFCVEPNEKR